MMNMNRAITKKKAMPLLVITFVFACMLAVPNARAENAPIKVFVNEQFVAFQNKPVQEQGRALVPIRETFSALQTRVQWDAHSRTVSVKEPSRYVRIQVGNNEAIINEETVALDVPPKMIDNTVYVPLRFVSESLGATVVWHPEQSTVNIRKDFASNFERKSVGQIAKLGASIFLIEAYDATNELTGTGSGFLADETGTIVTNYHVINGAKIIRIVDTQQNKYTVNQIVYSDETRDLAFLTVTEPISLPKLTLGNSDDVTIGDDIVTIGSPKGLQNTVSNGIISAFRNFDGQALIQITAPITFGSSGGALFDMAGNVIGVTSSGIDAHGNLNFAIPINDVKKALQTVARRIARPTARFASHTSPYR
jgi:S1-C subfamily serine protease